MGRLLAVVAAGQVPVGPMLAVGIAILVAPVVAAAALMRRQHRP